MREPGGCKADRWLSLVTVVGAALVATSAAVAAQERPSSDKPNFVYVLTDDQTAATLPHMPAARQNLVTRGTTFENSVLTIPTCCPSRATFLHGQYAHNHGISGAVGAVGQAFADGGLDGSTVATWLDDAGYETALFGRYLNGYRQPAYVPPGWDRWHANSNRSVWADCFGVDGEVRCYDDRNPDPLLAQKAERFVHTNAAGGSPFFLWLSFGAPHQYDNGPPLYQRQDADKFRDVALPRPPSFDEADVSDKPPWLGDAPRLTSEQVEAMVIEHRARLRSLLTVNRAIRDLTQALAEAGELKNTYMVFTTANGYHLGEHWLEAGKSMPYKEDANFPLIVRGPGMAEDVRRDELVLNTDFAPTAPTVEDLAGAQRPPALWTAAPSSLCWASETPPGGTPRSWRVSRFPRSAGRPSRGVHGRRGLVRRVRRRGEGALRRRRGSLLVREPGGDAARGGGRPLRAPGEPRDLRVELVPAGGGRVQENPGTVRRPASTCRADPRDRDLRADLPPEAGGGRVYRHRQ
jgi:arylsulfatase A-like enzyme